MWDQFPSDKYANAKVHTRITQNSDHSNLNFEKWEKRSAFDFILSLHKYFQKKYIFSTYSWELYILIGTHDSDTHISITFSDVKQCHDLNFTCENLQRTNNE